jgi:hypothetical protein
VVHRSTVAHFLRATITYVKKRLEDRSQRARSKKSSSAARDLRSKGDSSLPSIWIIRIPPLPQSAISASVADIPEHVTQGFPCLSISQCPERHEAAAEDKSEIFDPSW